MHVRRARTTTASFLRSQSLCKFLVDYQYDDIGLYYLSATWCPSQKKPSELVDGHRPNSCWIFVRYHISEVSNSLSLRKWSTIHGKLELHVSLSWKEGLWTKPSWSMTSVPKKLSPARSGSDVVKCYKFCRVLIFGVSFFLWWTYPQHFKQHTCGRRGLFYSSWGSLMKLHSLTPFAFLWKKHLETRCQLSWQWKLTIQDSTSRDFLWDFLPSFFLCFVTLERKFDIHRPFFMISTKRCWSQNFWCGMVGDKNCASSWKMESSWKFQSSRS